MFSQQNLPLQAKNLIKLNVDTVIKLFYMVHMAQIYKRAHDDFSLKGFGLEELNPVNKQSSDDIWATNS